MTGLEIAVVKPDYGMAGGFERLLDRLVGLLELDGHKIHYRSFPGVVRPRAVWGIEGAQANWAKHPEYFRYLALTEEVRRLDLKSFDLVLSTQPPTYLADHPRILALFYHQARIFYDLADGFPRIDQVDPAHHSHAVKLVRQIDTAHLDGVAHWLAGSQECSNRLDDYWNVDAASVSLLHAPALSSPVEPPPPWDRSGPVLCVSRHEWPKRTEFMGAVAALMPQRVVQVLGGGTRQRHVEAVATALAARPHLAAELDPEDLWMNAAAKPVPFASTGRLSKLIDTVTDRRPGQLEIMGWTSDEVRDQAYRNASVVVAPAYREDYGLTALEAMLWQRPVVVCRDGGGLVDLVAETGAGLVVDPTPTAIAEGINRIVNDRELSDRLSENARQVPAEFTWKRCQAELRNAVEMATSSGVGSF